MTAAAAKSAAPVKSSGSKGRGVFQDKEKPAHVSVITKSGIRIK